MHLSKLELALMQALLQPSMQHGACVGLRMCSLSGRVKSTCRGGAAAWDLCEAASALLSASARGCRATGVLCCDVPFVSAATAPAHVNRIVIYSNLRATLGRNVLL